MCIDGLYIAMEHSYCSIIPKEKGLKYFDMTMVHLVSSILPCFICDGCHYNNYHQLQIILLLLVIIITITIIIIIQIGIITSKQQFNNNNKPIIPFSIIYVKIQHRIWTTMNASSLMSKLQRAIVTSTTRSTSYQLSNK